MRHTPKLVLLLLAALVTLAVDATSSAWVERDYTRTVHDRLEQLDVLRDAPIPEDRRALTAYVFEAITAWPPPSREVDRVDLLDLARDIAAVALEQAPAWPDDVRRGRTAILLAALAYYEGVRFAQYVDDGSCNAWWRYAHALGWQQLPEHARRLLRYGTCDGSPRMGRALATSLWQVHEGELALEGGGTEHVTHAKLLDRRYAAAVALAIARRSIETTGGLLRYTGEPADEWGDHPKASQRLAFADRWWRRHPY